MELKQKGIKDLVEDAASGALRLPEFQRDWKWTRAKVIRLYDSIRKGYPIGSFLTLEASPRLMLSPRLFEGVAETTEDMKEYVLDGQQRITAGIALYQGLGRSQYFLDLEVLWQAAEKANLDYDDRVSLERFANELDEEEKYIVGRSRTPRPDDLLDRHLLWTKNLADDILFSRAKEIYLEAHPERTAFFERLITTFFKMGAEPISPVTVLDTKMPLDAITRVFETLNTSGQRLTPVEIVVAVLFARNVHLRIELDEYRDMTNYYPNIEATGELFLQTIALMSDKNPKRSALPRNIEASNYTRHRDDAMNSLELAGKFLSEHFGAGIDRSSDLIPYPAMLPPLGIALADIEHRYPQPSPDKARWYRHLERWFVGSVLEQRYSQSQPTTQAQDTKDLQGWIREGDSAAPDWLAEVRIRSMDRLTPASAVGKLVAMLISRQNPKDPLNSEQVGGNGAALQAAQSHHVFPRAFCFDHVVGWDQRVDNHNLALNVIPVTRQTNQRWSKMNPADQIQDVQDSGAGDVGSALAPHFINDECLGILKKRNKTREDFHAFVFARGREIQRHIEATWNFRIDTELAEDEDDEPAV